MVRGAVYWSHQHYGVRREGGEVVHYLFISLGRINTRLTEDLKVKNIVELMWTL